MIGSLLELEIDLADISTQDNKRDVVGYIEAGTEDHIIEIIRSIEENSYIPERIITLTDNKGDSDFKYLVVEGNHRILALKAMCGKLEEEEAQRFNLNPVGLVSKCFGDFSKEVLSKVLVQIVNDDKQLKFIVKEAHTNSIKKEFQMLAQIKDRVESGNPSLKDKEIIACLNYALDFILTEDELKMNYKKLYRRPTIVPKIFLKNSIIYDNKKFKFENVLLIEEIDMASIEKAKRPFTLSKNYKLKSKPLNDNNNFFENLETLKDLIELLQDKYCKNYDNEFSDNENNLPGDDKTSLHDLDEFGDIFNNILKENPSFNKWFYELEDINENSRNQAKKSLNTAIKKVNSRSSEHTRNLIYEIANNKPKVFISHASEDKVIGDCICEILKNVLNIKNEDIFYSSDRELSPTGKLKQMRDHLRNTENLIVMVTSGYYITKEWPLFELGAAWVNFNSCNKFVFTTNYDYIEEFQNPFSLGDNESVKIRKYDNAHGDFVKVAQLLFDIADAYFRNNGIERCKNKIEMMFEEWKKIDFTEYDYIQKLGDIKKQEFDKLIDRSYLEGLNESE